MGVDMRLKDSKFGIEYWKLASAFKTLREMGERPESYKFVDMHRLREAKSFGEAVKEWVWNATHDVNGNIISVEFQGDRAGDEEALFTALAPYVTAGSFIELEYPEHGGAHRFEFDGNTMKVIHGRLSLKWESVSLGNTAKHPTGLLKVLALDPMRCCAKCATLAEGQTKSCCYDITAMNDPWKFVCDKWRENKALDVGQIAPKVIKDIELTGVSLITEDQVVDEHCRFKVHEQKSEPEASGDTAESRVVNECLKFEDGDIEDWDRLLQQAESIMVELTSDSPSWEESREAWLESHKAFRASRDSTEPLSKTVAVERCWDCLLRTNNRCGFDKLDMMKYGGPLDNPRDGRQQWCPLPITYVPVPISPKQKLLNEVGKLARKLNDPGVDSDFVLEGLRQLFTKEKK